MRSALVFTALFLAGFMVMMTFWIGYNLATLVDIMRGIRSLLDRKS